MSQCPQAAQKIPGGARIPGSEGLELRRRARTEYRIVGENDADPKVGSISFVSPVARLLMGKAVGDVVGTSGQELEIISIS